MNQTIRHTLLFLATFLSTSLHSQDSKLFHEIYSIYGHAEVSTRAENKELSLDQLQAKLKEKAITTAEAKGQMRSLVRELYARELTTEQQDHLLVYLKLFGGLEDFIVWEKIKSDKKNINPLNYPSEDWLHFAYRRTTSKLLPQEPITEYMIKDSEQLEKLKHDVRFDDITRKGLSEREEEILKIALENGLKAIVVDRKFREIIESNPEVINRAQPR